MPLPGDNPRMIEEDVIDLLSLFEQNHLDVIIDGGWGVDALLGEQTRYHSDLDIVIVYQDVPRLREVLEEHGFTDVPRDDTRDVNFVMGDERGRLVDIHTYSLDRVNHPEQGLDYPPGSLGGVGTIGGRTVRCIEVKNMVNFHHGYPLDENDFHDVKALCLRFGIPLPPEYTRFKVNATGQT